MRSTRAEVLPLLGVSAGDGGAAAVEAGGAWGGERRRGVAVAGRVASLAAVLAVCGAVFAVSSTYSNELGDAMGGPGSGSLLTLLGGAGGNEPSKSSPKSSSSASSKHHHSSSSGAAGVGASSSSSSTGGGGGKSGSKSAVPKIGKSEAPKHSVTAKCQNIPADNAAGTFQFEDNACGKSGASTPAGTAQVSGFGTRHLILIRAPPPARKLLELV